MRLAIYTDYIYHRHQGEIYGERAFALFLARLAEHVDEAVVVGRLDPAGEPSRYPIGDRIRFVPLPFYRSLDRVIEVGRALAGAARSFWRVLDEVDCVWVLGPNPFAIVFALMALLRGRKVALGVRSEMVPYVRSRHPGNRLLELAALALDGGFKLLSRRCPVVAVGPEIGSQYLPKADVLEILVSLVDESDVVNEPASDPGPKTTVLSVGRLESEKNPLLLADCLAVLGKQERVYELIVCGEGPMAQDLEQRLDELGVADAVEMVGYLSIDGGLRDLYASADVLLHASWTEGFPQVLLEAFAAGLPVVATDVGGIAAAAGDAVRLIPPGDPEAAAEAVHEVATDQELRGCLVERGRAFVLEHTTDAETRAVAKFLAEA